MCVKELGQFWTLPTCLISLIKVCRLQKTFIDWTPISNLYLFYLDCPVHSTYIKLTLSPIKTYLETTFPIKSNYLTNCVIFIGQPESPQQFCWQSAASSSRKAKAVNNQQGYYKHVFVATVTHDPYLLQTYNTPSATSTFVNTHTHIFDLAPTSVLHFCLWPQAKQAKNTKNVLYFPKNQKYVADMCRVVCVSRGSEYVWVLGAWQSRAYRC